MKNLTLQQMAKTQSVDSSSCLCFLCKASSLESIKYVMEQRETMSSLSEPRLQCNHTMSLVLELPHLHFYLPSKAYDQWEENDVFSNTSATTTGRFAMKLCTDIHVLPRISHNFGDALAFHWALSSGQKINLSDDTCKTNDIPVKLSCNLLSVLIAIC